MEFPKSETYFLRQSDYSIDLASGHGD